MKILKPKITDVKEIKPEQKNLAGSTGARLEDEIEGEESLAFSDVETVDERSFVETPRRQIVPSSPVLESSAGRVVVPRAETLAPRHEENEGWGAGYATGARTATENTAERRAYRSQSGLQSQPLVQEKRVDEPRGLARQNSLEKHDPFGNNDDDLTKSYSDNNQPERGRKKGQRYEWEV